MISPKHNAVGIMLNCSQWSYTQQRKKTHWRNICWVSIGHVPSTGTYGVVGINSSSRRQRSDNWINGIILDSDKYNDSNKIGNRIANDWGGHFDRMSRNCCLSFQRYSEYVSWKMLMRVIFVRADGIVSLILCSFLCFSKFLHEQYYFHNQRKITYIKLYSESNSIQIVLICE